MSKCNTCIYRASSSFPWKCDYILHKNHSRGCEPGDNCSKYIKGERLVLSKSPTISYSSDSLDYYLNKFNHYN